MYVKIRLLGRSFHPMLVAYPVVLYTATVVAFAIYWLQGELFWFRLGHLANKAGVLLALITFLPGLIGWLRDLRRGARPLTSDLTYLGLNLAALVLFGLVAVLNAGLWDGRPAIGLPLLLSSLGLALTLAAGWWGWTLVQRQEDEATVWQWQVRAARLAEELEQTRAELARLRDLEGARQAGSAVPLGQTQAAPTSPSWSATAQQTWAGLAERAWMATPEVHTNPLRLVLAVVVTVMAVALVSLLPDIVRLR
jgi:uncharacterized membrane protein